MRAIKVLAVSYARIDTPRLRRAAEIQGVVIFPVLVDTIETE